ncbi:MAG TPA: 16S rRNA (cytidine(1402)-2'-O)-methyltransferase [Dehalococcoidia bacterium]|nr:16S rRNA (cytidine(1402)-2'-O)-methyltransferase [Dehalococcoidia bacterium]
MPVLYVVATPIGNLEDISLRALRILREVKLIATEDTRKTKRLLNRYEIKTPLISFHEHSGSNRVTYILERLEEEDVALVTEAGMPGISDPGYELVTGAVRQGFTVTPVPGPSAVTAALAVSGLSAERFLFVGFLPGKTNARRHALENIAENPATLVIFEAPHRLAASLNDIMIVLGDRNIAVCRELTKIHEEVFRGTVNQAITYFVKPRGEFTLVIEGNRDRHKPQMTEDIESQLKKLHHSGIPAREAIASTATETGLSRRELYRAWLKIV